MFLCFDILQGILSAFLVTIGFITYLIIYGFKLQSANIHVKTLMITLGAVCLCITFSFLESPPIADSGQYTMLLLYLLLYGLGRSLWETINKTVLSFSYTYFSKHYNQLFILLILVCGLFQ